MSEVWKYNITITDGFIIRMPKDAHILHFNTQYGNPRIWVLVKPDNEKETRYFRLAGTGHPTNCSVKNYIGTIKMMDDGLIYHLFELSGEYYKKIGG